MQEIISLEGSSLSNFANVILFFNVKNIKLSTTKFYLYNIIELFNKQFNSYFNKRYLDLVTTDIGLLISPQSPTPTSTSIRDYDLEA